MYKIAAADDVVASIRRFFRWRSFGLLRTLSHFIPTNLIREQWQQSKEEEAKQNCLYEMCDWNYVRTYDFLLRIVDWRAHAHIILCGCCIRCIAFGSVQFHHLVVRWIAESLNYCYVHTFHTI